jgi:hypothetical protein
MRSPARAPIRSGWSTLYVRVKTDGPPAVGRISHHHFKARLQVPKDSEYADACEDVDAKARATSVVDQTPGHTIRRAPRRLVTECNEWSF